MKLSQLIASAHNHILVGELILSAKRIVKAIQIWRIDRRYTVLSSYLDCYEHAIKEGMKRTEAERAALLLRRQELRRDMVNMGGR